MFYRLNLKDLELKQISLKLTTMACVKALGAIASSLLIPFGISKSTVKGHAVVIM